MTQSTESHGPTAAQEAFDKAKDEILHRNGRGLEKILKETPAAAKETSYWGKATLLMIAAGQGQLKSFKLLLPLSDPKALDEDGGTLLMAAAGGGNVKIARLAKAFCAGDEANKEGEDALMIAAKNGKATPELVKELAQGANRQATGGRAGGTALIHMAQSFAPKSADCIRELIRAGWELEVENESGAMPLDFACLKKESFWAVWESLGDDAKKRGAEKTLRWAMAMIAADEVLEELSRFASAEAIAKAVDRSGAKVPGFVAKLEAKALQAAVNAPAGAAGGNGGSIEPAEKGVLAQKKKARRV